MRRVVSSQWTAGITHSGPGWIQSGLGSVRSDASVTDHETDASKEMPGPQANADSSFETFPSLDKTMAVTGERRQFPCVTTSRTRRVGW